MKSPEMILMLVEIEGQQLQIKQFFDHDDAESGFRNLKKTTDGKEARVTLIHLDYTDDGVTASARRKMLPDFSRDKSDAYRLGKGPYEIPEGEEHVGG